MFDALHTPAPEPPAHALCGFDPYRLVAFGGSAGAIPALLAILSCLPADFPIPVVVVQHLAARFESCLPRVLGRHTALRCAWAADGRWPRPGTVHVAPPGTSLTLTAAGRFRVVSGEPKPRLGGPSVDAFLGSMAAVLGSRAVAVVLSGVLSDGADGIRAVRRSGGATMAQRLDTAPHWDMPAAALDFGKADLQMSPERIAQALLVLAERGVE